MASYNMKARYRTMNFIYCLLRQARLLGESIVILLAPPLEMSSQVQSHQAAMGLGGREAVHVLRGGRSGREHPSRLGGIVTYARCC